MILYIIVYSKIKLLSHDFELMICIFFAFSYRTDRRRIVVALIYWVDMANNKFEHAWYQDQIQEGRTKRSALKNRQSSVARKMACYTKTYKQASLNSMAVGNTLGELVKHIKVNFANGRRYESYCIGLSLGAHLCGFIGKSSGMVRTSMTI